MDRTEGLIACELCHGTGESPVYRRQPCVLCQGTGLGEPIYPVIEPTRFDLERLERALYETETTLLERPAEAA